MFHICIKVKVYFSLISIQIGSFFPPLTDSTLHSWLTLPSPRLCRCFLIQCWIKNLGCPSWRALEVHLTWLVWWAPQERSNEADMDDHILRTILPNNRKGEIRQSTFSIISAIPVQFCIRNPWELWKVYSLCICRMTSIEVTITPKACMTLAGATHSTPATGRWQTALWRVRKVTGLAGRFSHPVAVCFGTNLETLTQRPANKLHGVCISYIHWRDRQMPGGKKRKKEKWTQLLSCYKMFCSLPISKASIA